MTTAYYRIPVGIARVCADGKKVSSISLVGSAGKNSSALPPVLKKCGRELSEFFRGRRRRFSVPLRLEGTVFQKKSGRRS